MSKSVVIIGASSGIGRELAVQYAAKGYTLGIAARRVHLLEELKSELESRYAIQVFTTQMDINDPQSVQQGFASLFAHIEPVDIGIIASGIGFENPTLDDQIALATIQTNVVGCTLCMLQFYRLFERQGFGHLVGISSISAVRGSSCAMSYAASKSYFSNYLEGLRFKAVNQKRPIYVTDIRPGFVDTAMAKGDVFWCAPVPKAVSQMIVAIQRKKKCVYVTKRWGVLAILIRLLPDRLLGYL